MPIGNINIASRISEIHRLAARLEQEAATPGTQSRTIMDLFGQINIVAAEGMRDAASEYVENATMAIRAGRPI